MSWFLTEETSARQRCCVTELIPVCVATYANHVQCDRIRYCQIIIRVFFAIWQLHEQIGYQASPRKREKKTAENRAAAELEDLNQFYAPCGRAQQCRVKGAGAL